MAKIVVKSPSLHVLYQLIRGVWGVSLCDNHDDTGLRWGRVKTWENMQKVIIKLTLTELILC